MTAKGKGSAINPFQIQETWSLEIKQPRHDHTGH